MLKHLHIQNYALISHLDIDFNTGFSVLTGETGAGKSIILGALALVLGARADSKSITDGEDKCIIEAEFDECIIRRELYANGKSRSFVDDSVVTLQELKVLANKLIDIHSQHANLLIENADFQLEVVDAIAQNDAALNEYSAHFEQYTTAVENLRHLQALAKKSQQDADYIQYRFKLLDEANLETGELEALEQEQYQLSHAEEIRAALETAVAALSGEQGSAIEALRACRLEDAASDAENIEELITLRDELAEQVNRLDSFDYDIEQAQKAVEAERATLTKCAKALTESRKTVIPQICERLMNGLKRLGVAHAKVEIPITPTEDFTPRGCDEVQILFAANLNQSLRNVSEVASGGEISRLMLCVKALIASTKGLPTIIFDEIDTGVSGDIATQMASIMREMSAHRQIIAITHLPQIAALGENHYKVYKVDTATRTETHISRLSDEERITEIASMLSGKNATEASLKTAKELLCYH